MILSIVGPTENLLAAYDRVLFDITQIHFIPATSPTQEPTIQMEVFMNGASQGVEYYNAYEKINVLNPTTNSYIWELDAREIIQNFFDNEESFPGLGVPDAFGNPNCQADLFVRIGEWLPDADGILQEPTTFTDSQTYSVINSVMDERIENLNLEDYDPNVTAGAKFLTNKPESMNVVCPDDTEYLSAWDMAFNPFFLFFGIDGTALGASSHSNSNNDGVTTIGVGPANLNNSTPVFGGGNNTPANPVKYYELVTVNYERRRYWIDWCCCRTYRVHFLNMFGKWDSFSVYQDRDESFIVKSTTFEKLRPRDYNNRDRGVNRLQSKGTRVWEINEIRLSDEEVAWLWELKMSPNIYIEDFERNEVIPVRAEDATKAEIDTQKRYNTFELKLIASNSYYSQRN